VLFNRRVPIIIRTAYQYDSAGAVLFGVFFGFCTSFFIVIARKIGCSQGQISLLISAPFIGATFTSLWARHSVRFHKMHFLVLTKIFARGAIAFMIFAKTRELYIALVVIYWFFEMAAAPAYGDIMRDAYPDEERGRAMALVRAEMATAAIIATYIGGWLLDKKGLSYRELFFIGSLFGLASLCVFRKIPIKNARAYYNGETTISFARFREIMFSDRAFRNYILFIMIFGFGNLMAQPVYPIIIVDHLKLSMEQVGRINAIFSFCWMLSFFWWASFLKKKEPLHGLEVAIIVLAFVPLAYAVAGDVKPIMLSAVCSGVAVAGLDLCRLAYITKCAPSGKVQSYVAIDTTLMGLRGLVAPFLGSVLAIAFGIRAVLYCATTFIIFSFIGMRTARKVNEGGELYARSASV